MALAFAKAATLLDEPALAESAATVGVEVRRSLWDEQAGALVDTDEDRVRHPQDANVIAILAGILDDKDADRALAYLRDRCWLDWGSANVDVPWEGTLLDLQVHNRRVYAFMNAFEVAARFKRRDASDALELMRRCWGHMLERDPGTFWEWIGADGEVETAWASCAHGWSAGCLTLLTEQVLGVRPVAEGYREVVIDPAETGLAGATGTVPTPRGPLRVRWERRGTATTDLELSVDAPEGVHVTVAERR
jgi:hypothetical protein